METTAYNRWFYVLGFVFILTGAYLTYLEQMYFTVVPIGLVLIYTALYHFEKIFLIVVFFTPLSVNIEEFVGGDIGLFLPTEPLLFGMMLIILFHQIRKNAIPINIIKHPISIIIFIQLIWIYITAINSEYPIVSFKFLLTKLWFFIPLYFYGILFFKQKQKNIYTFLWLFVISMTIVIVYTLFNHALNGFSEPSGHWVMFPFFKDHTSYGAILALVFPILFGLLFAKKNSSTVNLFLISLIGLVGFAIIMSYTRAAWLSLIGAFLVYLLIYFKIKFKYLALIGLVGIIYIAVNWVPIMHSLEKNNAEHTTENMDERIESMANVTTDASNLERINRWACAINMWQERPIMGWGPGTYAMVYAPFQLSRNLTIISTHSGNMGNAHSEYLSPLAEQGLIGFIIMLALVGFIIYRGIIVYIKLLDRETKIVVVTCLLGLITYFAHGILNNYLDTDKASVPVWCLTAYIVYLDLKVKNNLEKH